MAEPFPYSTLVEMLQYWSVHDAHKSAFIFVDKHRTRFELTRRQLYELGGRWAAVLQEEGVGRKERVVSTLTNGPERVLCDVGIVMAGAVMVNAQCQLADGSDMLHVLRQSKARAVCVNPDLDFGPWQALKQYVQHDPVTNTVISHSLPDLRKVFFIRRTTPLSQDAVQTNESSTGGYSEPTLKTSETDAFLQNGFSFPETGDFIASLRAKEIFYVADVVAEETVVVFTTSGSTGFSKLVPNVHASLLRYFYLLKTLSGGMASMTFSSSPLGWAGSTTFQYCAQGNSRLLLDMWYGVPDDLAAVVWDSIVQERCCDGVIMPFLLPKILALEGRKPWKLKNIVMGGQPIKKENVQQALHLAEKVVIGYGSTELNIITAVPVTDVCHYQDFLVGKPVPNSMVKVCDPDGKEMPRGSKGEIYAKTPFMFKGYMNSSEDTEATFTADGFLKTGDIGMMLEDGSLLVEGRQNDAIHRGNYIFYPGWLESRIMHCCPELQNVIVVGVPDPEMGEEICACFVPSDPAVTEGHVRRLVEEDILVKLDDPMSPRPRYYLSFEAFSTTFTDKPLRKDVRHQARERLCLA